MTVEKLLRVYRIVKVLKVDHHKACPSYQRGGGFFQGSAHLNGNKKSIFSQSLYQDLAKKSIFAI